MIDIEKLTESDKGRWVQYIPAVGSAERGILKGWNHLYVFVVSKCDGKWDYYRHYTGQATSPEDLTFIATPEDPR